MRGGESCKMLQMLLYCWNAHRWLSGSASIVCDAAWDMHCAFTGLSQMWHCEGCLGGLGGPGVPHCGICMAVLAGYHACGPVGMPPSETTDVLDNGEHGARTSKRSTYDSSGPGNVQAGGHRPCEEPTAAPAREMIIKRAAHHLMERFLVDRFLNAHAAAVYLPAATTASKRPRTGKDNDKEIATSAQRPLQGCVEEAVASEQRAPHEHIGQDHVSHMATQASPQRPLHQHMLQPLAPNQRLDTFETSPMLDAAAVVVRAVHRTLPASVTTWLIAHPNMMTRDGQYRPIKRFLVDHHKKVRLCHLFRRFHGNTRPGRTNREVWEPLHTYLPTELVTLAVRQLLWEMRERMYDFQFPFPGLPLRTDEYIVWLQDAVHEVENFLSKEREEFSPAPAIRDA
jgi:hypothetical protein